MIDDVSSKIFRSMAGVSYFLTLKLNSQHAIDYFLPKMEKIIVEHIEHWHEKVTYQNLFEGHFHFILFMKRD